MAVTILSQPVFLDVASYSLLAAKLSYSGAVSHAAEVLDDVEGVVHDEPVNGVLEVSLEHAPAVNNLLVLCVVVVLNLKLVHVVSADGGTRVQMFQESFLAQHVEYASLVSSLAFQLEVSHFVVR